MRESARGKEERQAIFGCWTLGDKGVKPLEVERRSALVCHRRSLFLVEGRRSLMVFCYYELIRCEKLQVPLRFVRE